MFSLISMLRIYCMIGGDLFMVFSLGQIEDRGNFLSLELLNLVYSLSLMRCTITMVQTKNDKTTMKPLCSLISALENPLARFFFFVLRLFLLE